MILAASDQLQYNQYDGWQCHPPSIILPDPHMSFYYKNAAVYCGTDKLSIVSSECYVEPAEPAVHAMPLLIEPGPFKKYMAKGACQWQCHAQIEIGLL